MNSDREIELLTLIYASLVWFLDGSWHSEETRVKRAEMTALYRLGFWSFPDGKINECQVRITQAGVDRLRYLTRLRLEATTNA